MRSQCLLLFAQILILLTTYVTSEHLENDLIHDTDVNFYRNFLEQHSSDDDFELVNSEIVQTEKRHSRTTVHQAKAGKLVNFRVPEYSSGTKLQNLPDSLSYVDGNLTGVFLARDVGTHTIYILPVDDDSPNTSPNERLRVEVSSMTDSDILKDSECPSEEVTLLTFVSAVKGDKIQNLQLAQVLHTISKYFSVNIGKISVTSEPMLFSDVTTSVEKGPGDRSSSMKEDGLHIFFPVGCNEPINKDKEMIKQKIEALVKKNYLSKILSIDILRWQLSEVDLGSKRSKREVDDYYDYSGDDEYDYLDEHFNYAPSLASPVFPESPATEYNPDVPVEVTQTSVLRPAPLPTAVYIPSKPSVVVEPSPSFPHEDFSHTELQSSLLTHPTTMVTQTTPLTIGTTLSSSPTRDRLPLEPTAVHEIGLTTEYDMKNFPPTIEERIPKLAWVAGMSYRMKIPENAFADIEDGNARNLSIILKNENGQIFGKNSWIHFEPTKQEIYALPLENNIGKYDFILEAIDKGHKSVRDLLKISVRQSKEVRNYNHQFTATLKLEKKHEYEFQYALDWQVKAVEKIASFFGDENTNNINIRNITFNPVHITWTNISLVNSEQRDCPEEELRSISEKMVHNFGTDPTREMKEAFMPEFKLKKIHSRYDHPCEKLNEHHHKAETHGSSGMTPDQDHLPIEMPKSDDKPIFRNQIDQLNATEGQMFKFKVPSDTCYDLEDGDTRGLHMSLITTDLQKAPPSSWLQFDETNQEFYGLPLTSDIGKRNYILVCIDNANHRVSETLIVRVYKSPYSPQPPVKFSVTINMDYGMLMTDASMKVELVEKIARAFGDDNTDNVLIESLIEGSVVVTWRNTTLSSEQCPEAEIRHLREIMTDDKGIIREGFKNRFGRFNITEGMIIPYGECLAGGSPTYPEELDHGPPEEKPIGPSEESYLLTYIVPAVIIAIMLLLAALIACCLYRKRRYGKMSMTDDRTFVSKGIPIIFAEELDDHRTDNAKSPVIMKEEKPPLPPPEYQKSSPSMGYVAASQSGTPPRMDRRRHASGEPLNSGDDAPYHPPPPFTSSNGASRNQRPNLPPAYRKPPTYVPP